MDKDPNALKDVRPNATKELDSILRLFVENYNKALPKDTNALPHEIKPINFDDFIPREKVSAQVFPTSPKQNQVNKQAVPQKPKKIHDYLNKLAHSFILYQNTVDPVIESCAMAIKRKFDQYQLNSDEELLSKKEEIDAFHLRAKNFMDFMIAMKNDYPELFARITQHFDVKRNDWDMDLIYYHFYMKAENEIKENPVYKDKPMPLVHQRNKDIQEIMQLSLHQFYSRIQQIVDVYSKFKVVNIPLIGWQLERPKFAITHSGYFELLKGQLEKKNPSSSEFLEETIMLLKNVVQNWIDAKTKKKKD